MRKSWKDGENQGGTVDEKDQIIPVPACGDSDLRIG